MTCYGSAVLHAVVVTTQYEQHRHLSLLPDDDTLVFAIPMHVAISVITDGKDVWWEFPHFMTFVHLDLLCSVDGQDLIRIDSHQN